MRVGVFVRIIADERALGQERAKRLVSVCPVDVFGFDGGSLMVKPDQEDECTFCELCLEIAPRGSVIIRKTYKDEELTSRGAPVDDG